MPSIQKNKKILLHFLPPDDYAQCALRQSETGENPLRVLCPAFLNPFALA